VSVNYKLIELTVLPVHRHLFFRGWGEQRWGVWGFGVIKPDRLCSNLFIFGVFVARERINPIADHTLLLHRLYRRTFDCALDNFIPYANCFRSS
jgi:hypothetical protein